MPRHGKFKITGRELALAVALAALGFVFSTRQWLLWMNGFSPFQGLIIYYVILYGSLYVLSKMGLTIFGIKIAKASQMIGLLLCTFAFFLVVDMSSAYVGIVTGVPNIPNVFLQCEDGMSFWAFSQIVPNIELCRILTYVILPFVLVLVGTFLASGKIRIGLP